MTDSSAVSTIDAEDYVVARFYGAWQARPDLKIRARVENVTDEDYWASAGGYPGAGYLTIGAPRTFILSAAFDF